MTSRLDAIAQRRAALVDEIGLEREHMSGLLESLGKQVAMASLGIMASRLLGRSRWLRFAAAGVAAVSMIGPVLARFFASRR